MTLGMNVAFRYWQRIDWRPNYYCCLDDALIDTHKEAILELILEQRIERYFLSGRILEYYPELSQYPNVFFLDQFVEHWYRVRGKQFGLSFIEDSAFQTTEPEMLTTGAYSVRFGAYLGFEVIKLLGIDLTYTPIADVRSLEGTRLEMTRTPAENPNYFFDDYQTIGDQFNVANPIQHGRDLHFSSFVTLRDDFVRNSVRARLKNGESQSRLFRDAVLPYQSLRKENRGSETKTSVQLVLKWPPNSLEWLSNVISLWGQSAFCPMLKSGPRIDLVISTRAPLLEQAEERIRRQINADARLRSCFDEIRFSLEDNRADLDVDALDNKNNDAAAYDIAILLDENCVPLTCDWLGMLIDQKGAPSLFLQLPRLSNSLSDLQRFRDDYPEVVVGRCVGLAQKFANPKLSKLPLSLAELVELESDQWTTPKPDSKKLSEPSSILKSVLAIMKKRK